MHVDLRFLGLETMNIDVFTLFPDWFGWFSSAAPRAQRPRTRATRCPRWTCGPPRRCRAGQVDDTPYGGGAGMVIRVDVVEAALRERYGQPTRWRPQPGRRVIALSAGGRQLRRRSGHRARGRGGPDAALRALRGLRRARSRAPGHRRGVDRPVRAGRRGAGGDGGLRRRASQAPGDPRTLRQRGGGVLQRSAGGRRPSIRSTRGHPNGAATACPRSWCPATMPACGSGGSSRAACAAR